MNKKLKTKVKSKNMKLTVEQLNELLLAKKEVENGLLVEQDILDKSFEQWKREK